MLESVRENYIEATEELRKEGENIKIVDGYGNAEREVFPNYRDSVIELLKKKGFNTVRDDNCVF